MSSRTSGISVILPFYEHGPELGDAIRSIVEQTHREWQLLLVANNAGEKALKLAQQWAQKESRITLLHEPLQGIAYALNIGLYHSAHPYIARMDADDISMPERLERQLAFLQQHPEIGLVSCRTRFESTVEATEGFQRFVDWQNGLITPEQHFLYRFVESPVAHPSVLFRRSLIEQWGGYDTGPIPEDYELWLRWMNQDIAFYKLPEALLVWRDSPQRLTRTHPHYSQEAFWEMKSHYLASWIQKHVSPDRKIVLCGASRTGRMRGALLASHGIPIYGYTDVKKRILRDARFVPLDSITMPESWFLINVITKRGVGEAVAKYFAGKGFREGVDFVRAG